MNKEFMLELAERLDLLGSTGQPIDGMTRFYMPDYVKHLECGTACCLAGGAVALAIEKKMEGFEQFNDIQEANQEWGMGMFDLAESARTLLGLDNDGADALFNGQWLGLDGVLGIDTYTSAQSGAAILRDIATGKAELVDLHWARPGEVQDQPLP